MLALAFGSALRGATVPPVPVLQRIEVASVLNRTQVTIYLARPVRFTTGSMEEPGPYLHRSGAGVRPPWLEATWSIAGWRYIHSARSEFSRGRTVRRGSSRTLRLRLSTRWFY